MYEQRKLGDILVHLGVMSEFDVDRVLDAMDRRYDQQKFGQMARDMGLVSEEHILAAMAVQMELFPGIEQWNLTEILRVLVTAEEPAGAGRWG